MVNHGYRAPLSTVAGRSQLRNRMRSRLHRANRVGLRIAVVAILLAFISLNVIGFATGAIQYHVNGFGYEYTIHVGDFHYTYTRGYSFGN